MTAVDETRSGRFTRGQLRGGIRTLVRQDLPTSGIFPPGVDLMAWRVLRRHYFVCRAPRHIEHVFIEGYDNYGKAVHYRLLAAATGDGLLTNEGEHWTSQRRLIQPVFAKRHIDQLVPHMTDATTAFLARFDAPAPPATADIAQAMTELTLDVVGRALFGASLAGAADELRPAVAFGMNTALAAARLQMVLGLRRRTVDAAAGVLTRAALPGPAGRVRRALQTVDRVVNGIIDGRVADDAPHDDLLALLLAARDEDGNAMPRRQVRDEVVTMMLAGHETTANGLAWTWHLLASNPDAYNRAREEVDRVLGDRVPTAADLDRLVWTRAVFQEALRLYPPAWVLEREAKVDDEIDGTRIPKGATVIFPVHIIQRDPRWWTDPDSFDPSRFLPDAPAPARGTYLPFGAGRRICVGASFALTEGTLIAAMLLQRYRFDSAPGHDVTPSATVTLRPRGGLPMLVTARMG